MLTIRRSNVPQYLRESEFYVSLGDDEGDITIPETCLKNDTSVTNPSDLRQLLSTLRFWGVGWVPEEVYELSKIVSFFDEVAAEFSAELTYLSALRVVRSLPPDEKVVDCARCGCLELLTYLLAHDYPLVKQALVAAATAGHLPCLRYLRSLGCEWDEEVCTAAVRNGHYACLKYAHENGCPWDERTISSRAAYSGCVKCLQYVCEHSTELHPLVFEVISVQDHVACLEYMHSTGRPWPDGIVLYMVYNDSLRCLEFALSHGCTPPDDSILNAVKSTEALRIIHNSGHNFTEVDCARAANVGNVQLLRCLHELGCSWDENTFFHAALHKSMECFIYAHENGCPWSSSTTLELVRCRNVPALQYALEHGCPITTQCACLAVEQNEVSLPLLTCLHEHSCSMDETVTTNAVKHDNICCFTYARNVGCPVSADICRTAAENNRFDTLKYLQTQGFRLISVERSEYNNLCVDYIERHQKRRCCIQ